MDQEELQRKTAEIQIKLEEKKQQLKNQKQLSGDEATGGPSQTPEQIAQQQWIDRKNRHVTELSESELLRVAEEKKQKRLAQEKEMRETAAARVEIEKRYWDDIEKSCLDGDPLERFARCLMRMANQNLLVNTMAAPAEKQRRIVQLLRLHGIQIRDSKEKIPITGFMQNADMFVEDMFVRKCDVVLTRRVMFPEGGK